MSGLRVLSAGPATLLVDGGRPAGRSLGVPVGGAADRAALTLGNAIVGNPPDTPALEMALAGPTLEALGRVHAVAFVRALRAALTSHGFTVRQFA